jgi:hypothetical protein
VFFVVVGAVIGVVLLLAGISDVRTRLRSGRTTRVDGAQVTERVLAARSRARQYRRPSRF